MPTLRVQETGHLPLALVRRLSERWIPAAGAGDAPAVVSATIELAAAIDEYHRALVALKDASVPPGSEHLLPDGWRIDPAVDRAFTLAVQRARLAWFALVAAIAAALLDRPADGVLDATASTVPVFAPTAATRPDRGPAAPHAPPTSPRGIEGAAPARSTSTFGPDLTPEGLAA